MSRNCFNAFKIVNKPVCLPPQTNLCFVYATVNWTSKHFEWLNYTLFHNYVYVMPLGPYIIYQGQILLMFLLPVGPSFIYFDLLFSKQCPHTVLCVWCDWKWQHFSNYISLFQIHRFSCHLLTEKRGGITILNTSVKEHQSGRVRVESFPNALTVKVLLSYRKKRGSQWKTFVTCVPHCASLILLFEALLNPAPL